MTCAQQQERRKLRLSGEAACGSPAADPDGGWPARRLSSGHDARRTIRAQLCESDSGQPLGHLGVKVHRLARAGRNLVVVQGDENVLRVAAIDAIAVAVDHELVDEVALCGPKERIKDQLAAWRESGAKTIICGTTNIEAIRTMAELLA